MDQNQLFSPAIGLVPPWLVDHVSFTVERTASPEPHHERLVRAFHDGAGHEVAIVIPDTLRGLLCFRVPGRRGRVVII